MEEFAPDLSDTIKTDFASMSKRKVSTSPPPTGSSASSESPSGPSFTFPPEDSVPHAAASGSQGYDFSAFAEHFSSHWAQVEERKKYMQRQQREQEIQRRRAQQELQQLQYQEEIRQRRSHSQGGSNNCMDRDWQFRNIEGS